MEKNKELSLDEILEMAKDMNNWYATECDIYNKFIQLSAKITETLRISFKYNFNLEKPVYTAYITDDFSVVCEFKEEENNGKIQNVYNNIIKQIITHENILEADDVRKAFDKYRQENQ